MGTGTCQYCGKTGVTWFGITYACMHNHKDPKTKERCEGSLKPSVESGGPGPHWQKFREEPHEGGGA